VTPIPEAYRGDRGVGEPFPEEALLAWQILV
jgi:hypothetical protein